VSQMISHCKIKQRLNSGLVSAKEAIDGVCIQLHGAEVGRKKLNRELT
jgi:hypothetical protein